MPILKEHRCRLILLTVWFVFILGQAVWLYFYVKASVDPNPRTAVNRTKAAFTGFEIMMFIWGFFLSCINLTMVWTIIFWVAMDPLFNGPDWRNVSPRRKAFKWSFAIFIAFPICACLLVLPGFGGWILVPLAQSWAWDHRCDSYPMYAVLDARSFKDPSYIPNVAKFYQTDTNQLLFTYDVNEGTDSDLWMFAVRQFNTPSGLIPVDQYPTLQSIQYDFINTALTGNCTVPISPGSSNTTTMACMTGTYNPDKWLSFNVTSIVPLNNTDLSTPVPSSTTLLRTVDKEWVFGDNNAPALILRTVNPVTDQLTDQTVLRTAVTKRGDCTALKVCLSGTARLGSIVGAEVLAPLGLILIRQVDHARICTLPSSTY
ncbi:hypothetical protein BXZ70DRAFT_431020 [Cristinia sonorae]|uniref:Uncharacterized protein n=1 Tax=Cristinia sonorae TaxID=1940300 RepID=A0A8K0UWF9_9AGAR|nr:hypothetical protein BXZ70DRAFT_431020 [Cristinia sonorae]